MTKKIFIPIFALFVISICVNSFSHEDYNAAGLTVQQAIQTLLPTDLTKMDTNIAEVVAARDGEASLLAKINTLEQDATQTLTNKSIDSDNNTITNIVNADLKAGAAIDATKIADGSVSSAEFQYLNGVTSAIQTQLDAKPNIVDFESTGIDDNASSTAMTISSVGRVGIGTTDPKDTLHVYSGSSGQATPSTSPNLVLENNGQAGVNILTPSANIGSIEFGDENDNNIGFISYNHSTDKMTLTAGTVGALYIDSNGDVGIKNSSPGYDFEVTGAAHVSGEFTAGTKTFVIDHPLLPKDKILTHAVFEGPEHGLIYRGKTKLKDGKAVINIDEYFGMTPGTFDALTQDVFVQSLQNQDSFNRVRPGTIAGNTFEIICENSLSTDEIAWMVTAARKDPLVKHSSQNDSNGRLILEVDKEVPTTDDLNALENEIIEIEKGEAKTEEKRVDSLKNKQGYYLNPEAYGKTRPTKIVEYKIKK
jgi:hypothetical protein